jgi:hypothetical protein
MRSINWRLITEFVGISALVGSLIFVGVQIQLDRQVASSQVNMAALESRLAIEAAMAEHADAWAKAARLEALNESDAQIVKSLVRMARSKAFFESLAGSEVRGRDGSERFSESSPIISAFSTLLFENPGAREIWLARAARQDVYTKIISADGTATQFNNAVQSQLEKFDEAQRAGVFK